MYLLVKELGSLVNSDGTRTSSKLFRMHCSLTALFLFGVSLFLAGYQMFSEPISCVSDLPSMSEEMVNLHCWMNNIFTVPDVKKEVAIYPGVGPGDSLAEPNYHGYYLYVGFVVFLQAVLFRVPMLIWSSSERGLMKSLSTGLEPGILEKEKARVKITSVVDYIKTHSAWNSTYAASYLLCELLCLVNVAGQMYAIDLFLGNEFITFGWRAIPFVFTDPAKRTDPMQLVFPTRAMCNIASVGASGTLQRHSALCLLPQNVINEKVYVLMWFWFALVFSLFVLLLAYRVVTLLFPCARSLAIKMNNPIVLSKGLWQKLAKKMTLGDWWILKQLGKNIDPVAFQDLVVEYCESNPFHV